MTAHVQSVHDLGGQHSSEFPFLEKYVEAGVIEYGHFWTYAGCQPAYIDCLKLLDGHAGLLYRSLLALRGLLPAKLPDDVVYAGLGDGGVFSALLSFEPFMRLPGYVPGTESLQDIMARSTQRHAKMRRSETEQRAIFVRDQDQVVHNRSVVFVDDVRSSGRTAQKAVECILAAGGNIAAILFLVDTAPQAQTPITLDEVAYPVQSLVHFPIELHLKSSHERDSDCPQCAKRVPYSNRRNRP